MNNKIIFSIVFLFMVYLYGFAQENKSLHKVTLSSYVDTYFSGYSNDISQDEFQPFITVGARDNTFGINVAQLGLKYESQNIRSNFILHYGDIPQATWSENFNTIQEANIGIKLAKGLWLDAGFFATHIGTESFLPKNNLLSHTMYLTFNEPFYQAGAKLSYNKIKNWYFELWALNGYNNFVDNNDAKSIGILAVYNLNKSSSLTYTNLYGRESEDNATFDQNRFYQNLYYEYNWGNKLTLLVGFDYGMQTNSDLINITETAFMYGGMVTTRYQFNPKFSITGRAEIFNDKNGFISGTVQDIDANEAGIELTGFTLGTEYIPFKKSYMRAEIRNTIADNDLQIFTKNGELTNNRFEVLFTIGFELEKIFSF